MTESVAVVGAHGGAGARTVAGLLRATGVLVTSVDNPTELPEGAVPALVVRSTAAGVAAAAVALGDWPVHMARPFLVVVADVPAPPPPAVRYRLRELSDHVRGQVTVPFLWPLRAATEATDAADVRVVQKAAARLREALLAGSAVTSGP